MYPAKYTLLTSVYLIFFCPVACNYLGMFKDFLIYFERTNLILVSGLVIMIVFLRLFNHLFA